jgi:hypothetical protein
MPEIDEVKSETRAILARVIPPIQIVRIEATEAPDSGGENSLWLKIVVRRRPLRDDARKMPRVVDQLRSWLASRKDDRFPYVELITEKEEEELRHMSA